MAAGSVSLPNTMKQWRVISTEKDLDGVTYGDAAVPKPGEYEVLVRIHAAALNYRDLAIPKGTYPFPPNTPVVAGSDASGVVEQVGNKVRLWKKGDHVVTLVNQGHQFGLVTLKDTHTGLGGAVDGTLREYAVFNETGLVRAPENLNHFEASTLTIAGVTSWNALYGLRPLKPGNTVLVQGTGGVSLFALQFAKAAGARVIATTSSTKKVDILKKLGADHIINYKENTSWGKTAKGLTPNGEGVDHILDVGGADTLAQSLDAIKFEGVISVIGFLGGWDAKASVMECLSHLCTMRGVYGGSKAQMVDMVAAIEAANIKPVVDERVFTLEKTKEAYEYLLSQGHIGKVVIKIA
ncbi:NAD(P)-binding protein [Thozetella sp. PMI_491]|nr:NAD(P)-binding protein [Thozetella sp. PMI_491]